MKVGDIILYDLFGTPWEGVSPSISKEDYGIGLITSDVKSVNYFNQIIPVIDIMREDGTVKQYSLSYLKKL